MQRRNRNKKAPRRRNSGRRGKSGGNRPPPFRPTMRINHRFRYACGGSTGTNLLITRAALLNQVVYATSTSTTVRLVEAVRLKKVEIWTNPVALGAAPTTCAIEWLGENSPSVFISDTSMGVLPAHLSCRPPPSSSNRWWSMSGQLETDDLFGLTFPANTVIDVTVEARLVEQEAPTAGPVPTGATLGQIYGCTLDGNGVTGVLLPVGYTLLP